MAKNGHIEVINKLSESGASIYVLPMSDILQLFELGAAVNAQDNYERTALIRVTMRLTLLSNFSDQVEMSIQK